MDRMIVWPGAVPLETDLLNTNRNTLVALAKIISDVLGTSTSVTGLGCVPTSPASMSVQIQPGQMYALQNLDGTAYSSLPLDTTHQVMKQGILLDAATFACPAPTTAGYSTNFLIEANYADVDSNAVVLPFYNASNPTQAYSGPGGNGSASMTTRKGSVVLTLKAGVAAATGTQTTPAVDAGCTALWVVTVAYGQATITAANISQAANAPILPSSLLASLITNNLEYGIDSGAANTVQATFPLPPTSVSDNQQFWVKVKTTNTGATTFTPNSGVIAALPVVGAAHQALQGNELVANGRALFVYRADITSYVLESCTGASLQTSPATQSQHALQLGQLGALPSGQSVGTTGKLNGVNSPNLLVNGTGELANIGWQSSNFSAVQSTTGEGTVFTNSATISSTIVDVSVPFAIGAGVNVTLSGQIYTGGMTAGHANIDLQCYNSAGASLGTIATNITNFGQSTYGYTSNTGVTPAGTVSAAVRRFCDTSPVVAVGGAGFKMIKLEKGTAASLYSQEASIAAVGSATPVVGSARNVKMTVAAGATTATLTADEIFCETALGGFGYKVANVNQTINLAATGAGGMDTGTATANGFLGIYEITGPTVTPKLYGTLEGSVALPSIYGGTTGLPAGYTASTLVAVAPISATAGQFAAFSVQDRKHTIAEFTFINSNTTSGTAGNSAFTSTGIPKTALRMSGSISISNSAVMNSVWKFFADANSTGSQDFSVNTTSGGGGNLFGYTSVPLSAPQTVRATAFVGGGSGTMSYILLGSGYEI